MGQERERLLVSRQLFEKALDDIAKKNVFAIDTETTGLYPFHGDRAFSIAISIHERDYYFNFNQYPNLPDSLVLPETVRGDFQRLFKNNVYVFMQNAKFDMHMMDLDYSDARIHCTAVGHRLLNNEVKSKSLAAIGESIGIPKDDTVEKLIKSGKLYEPREREGKSWKQPRYDLVPFDKISTYAMRDTYVTYKAGVRQVKWIENQRQTMIEKPLVNVLKNESRLTQTVYKMEKVGVKCDIEFCREGVRNSLDKMERAKSRFKETTGTDFVDSHIVLYKAFKDTDLERFKKTDKGNYKFDEDILKTFTNPGSACVLDYRGANTTFNFLSGFLFGMDSEGFVHTDFDPAGTRTGRFSCRNPNLQNLKKTETGDNNSSEIQYDVIRKALVPRDGYIFVMIDYDQMEYRLLLNYSGARGLIRKVLEGLDVHTATAEVARVTRKQAKTVNFGTVYGQGTAALAESLGVSKMEAVAIQKAIFDAAPENLKFLNDVISTAKKRKYLINWLGRVYRFPKSWMSYKAPNTLIQGGAGDIVKVAMNKCDEFLLGYKSRLLLNIHDELVFEIHETELDIVPELKKLMEFSYPHEYLPLTCGIDFSRKSLADKRPWKDLHSNHVKETGNHIQRDSSSTDKGATENLCGENTGGR